jgi:hypothetical protein
MRSGDYEANGDYISVGEALELVSPFNGDKREVLVFIGNLDTTFAVKNPEQEGILYVCFNTH